MEHPGREPTGARHDEGHAVVTIEIGDALRGTATGDIVGRGDKAHRPVLDLAGNKATVRQLTHADGEIEAFGNQVDVAVGNVELDLDLGMERAEPAELRRQAEVPVCGRHAEADAAGDLAAAALNRALGVVDGREGGARLVEKMLSVVGETDAPRGAAQELAAEPRFKPRDGAADDGGCRTKGDGAGRQRAVLGHRHEHFDIGEVIETTGHLCLRRTNELKLRSFIASGGDNKVLPDQRNQEVIGCRLLTKG